MKSSRKWPGRFATATSPAASADPSNTARSPDSPDCQLPAGFIHFQPGEALVLVVDLLHLLHGIEVADDERGAERLARLHRVRWADFLDEADVADVVAPSLMRAGRVERHAREPRPVGA